MQKGNIAVYPNPASNSIYINFDNNSNLISGQPGEQTLLTINTVLGDELLRRPIQSGETIIDVSELQNGFYIVNVKTNKHQVNSTKLIIAK